MKIVKNLEEIHEETPCALALGTFDGLHLGHRQVLRAALKAGPRPGAFTFWSSPLGKPGLMTREDKFDLLKRMGLKQLYAPDFSEVRGLPPKEFVHRVLFERCRAATLCCGEDFRFGKDAAGDAALLKALCEEAGVALRIVPSVEDGGEKISSTRIRRAVEEGEIPLANRLMGRPFGFAAEVIHGNHLGTSLGTPTINQAIPEGLALPRFGVYAAWVEIDGRAFCGVTNIGVKPTVGSEGVLSETWMPDFSGDLYGKTVRLHLLKFIRPERKFASLEELKEEILRNAGQAQEIAAGAPLPEGL